jgi:hypothetical protein
LVYEHIKNNLKEAVLKIAEFLGEEFVLKLKENNEFLLNKILENCSIDAMKSITNFDVLKLVRKKWSATGKIILLKLKAS